ncbi:MAG: AAA family ATPase [Candidatus Nomurabacteria bacterium]|nr:AAA family ATPase [Candidatus Nomurabacteria bacterium]
MDKYKEKLLNNLKTNLDIIREKIRNNLEAFRNEVDKGPEELRKLKGEEQNAYAQLLYFRRKRLVELDHLEGSPYFMKVDLIDEDKTEKTYFFAKHQYSKESIYSWVAPVATIRFENPGQTSYKLPNGENRNVFIKQKEQYMIVDGKVIFFALENEKNPRELIYQEHFTKQKSEFALPEIVAQMEKAQDQVIRASHRGPLVISGPAGSGKTTLALHRVAYLTQAPDTAQYYNPDSIIVFVQDTGTKEYFSTLLPGLGINDVFITTFSQWALNVLNLDEYSYVERYGKNEEEKDLYEYQKIRALRENSTIIWNKNIFSTLNIKYEKFLSINNLKLFNKQKNEKKLDRFDLVILLRSHLEKYQKFEIKRKYKTFVKDKLVQKIEKTLVQYNLMVVDEFQNYLPEQLGILKNCLNENTKSTVYVGDIAQQVKLGTVKNWQEIGEEIPIERNIRLSKVYRNTKSILTFIKSLGYSLEIPESMKDGPIVSEIITHSSIEEINHIKKFISKYEKGSIGILSKDEAYLEDFKKEFINMKNIHFLSMLESQGVEFDLVFIVGINKDSFKVNHDIDTLPEHIEERKRMQKDLVYVALTRAITELHLLGKDNLRDILDFI